MMERKTLEQHMAQRK